MQSLLSDLSSPNHLIILLCIGCVLIFTLKSWLISQMSYNKSITLFFLYPGVVIHELSHLLFCILLGVRVRRVKLFDSGSGFVEYSCEKRNAIRDFLISIAPLLVGGTLLYLALKFLPTNYGYVVEALLLYVCFSIFLSMFPSKKDLSNAPLVYVLLFIILIVFRSKIFSLETISKNISLLIIVTAASLVIINILIYLARKIWKSK